MRLAVEAVRARLAVPVLSQVGLSGVGTLCVGHRHLITLCVRHRHLITLCVGLTCPIKEGARPASRHWSAHSATPGAVTKLNPQCCHGNGFNQCCCFGFNVLGFVTTPAAGFPSSCAGLHDNVPDRSSASQGRTCCPGGVPSQWRPWHLKINNLKRSLSQKLGCTAEVVTQSGTSVHSLG